MLERPEYILARTIHGDHRLFAERNWYLRVRVPVLLVLSNSAPQSALLQTSSNASIGDAGIALTAQNSTGAIDSDLKNT